MLLKLGVDISRLEPPIRKKLPIIENIIAVHTKKEMVITSTYEGNHSSGSLHYANLAIDIRFIIHTALVIVDLKGALGKNYDVVAEKDHIHIEYDPK